MIEFNGTQYFDDRLFVIEIASVTVPPDKRQWAVITRQNIQDYPVFRVDSFETMDQAVEYARSIEPGTPRISLGGRSPDPVPTMEQYRQWLESMGVWERHVWE